MFWRRTVLIRRMLTMCSLRLASLLSDLPSKISISTGLEVLLGWQMASCLGKIDGTQKLALHSMANCTDLSEPKTRADRPVEAMGCSRGPHSLEAWQGWQSVEAPVLALRPALKEFQ